MGRQGHGSNLATYIEQHRKPYLGALPIVIWCGCITFYEAYASNPELQALAFQLPWTHNLIILSQAKRVEEQEFYLRVAIQEQWTKRELERQFKNALFEQVALQPLKLTPLVSQLHPRKAWQLL